MGTGTTRGATAAEGPVLAPRQLFPRKARVLRIASLRRPAPQVVRYERTAVPTHA